MFGRALLIHIEAAFIHTGTTLAPLKNMPSSNCFGSTLRRKYFIIKKANIFFLCDKHHEISCYFCSNYITFVIRYFFDKKVLYCDFLIYYIYNIFRVFKGLQWKSHRPYFLLLNSLSNRIQIHSSLSDKLQRNLCILCFMMPDNVLILKFLPIDAQPLLTNYNLHPIVETFRGKTSVSKKNLKHKLIILL